MLKLGGFKLLLDGYAPVAYCYEPTDDIPWEPGTWDPDTLNKVTSMIHEAGYQIAMHCMDDRAIDMALDAYEYAIKKNAKPGSPSSSGTVKMLPDNRLPADLFAH